MTTPLKVQGINQFLAEIYDSTTTFDRFLARIEIQTQQREALHINHLEDTLSAYIEAVRYRLVTARKDGERLFYILAKRFSFDGEQALTLAELGDHLQVSRERVRQLQQKAIRSCRSSTSRIYCETTLRHFLKTLTDPSATESTPDPLFAHKLVVSPRSLQHNSMSVHPDDQEFITDLILAILQKIPDGISCHYLSHILFGSKGPIVKSLIGYYDLRLAGILKPLGFVRVNELVKYAVASDPRLAVCRGDIRSVTKSDLARRNVDQALRLASPSN